MHACTTASGARPRAMSPGSSNARGAGGGSAAWRGLLPYALVAMALFLIVNLRSGARHSGRGGGYTNVATARLLAWGLDNGEANACASVVRDLKRN